MNKPNKPSKYIKHAGFTLIEVLVAVSIFAIAGGAIMKTVYEHLRSINTIEQITFATWVANNQLTMTTVEAKLKWPLEKLTSGDTEMAGQRWYWKREAIKTADSTLYQITVSVALDEEMTQPISSVVSFMAKVDA